MKKYISFFLIIFLSFITYASASSNALVYCPDDDEPVSLRNSAGGTRIGSLECNSQLEVLDTNGGTTSNCKVWYKVRQDILTGYACSDYIKLDSESTSIDGKVLCIENDDPLNIWSDTSKSQKLKSLSCNASIKVLEKNVDSNSLCINWYRVSSNGTVGYACGKYIDTSTSSSSENTNTNVGKSTTGDNVYKKENYDSPEGGDGTISCYEDSLDVLLRSGLDSGSINGRASCGEIVQINDVKENTGTCKYYYNITNSKGEKGYVCGYFVNTTKLSSTALKYYSEKESLDSYYAFLKSKNFPDSYLPYLAEIHARHPNWIFNPEFINIDFSVVVENESAYGRNLLEGSAFNQNYYSMDIDTYSILNDKFYEYSTEKGWYNASSEAIAFYMDPRNYLNEKYIFAFESLNFNNSHDENTISKILSSQSFWPQVYSSFDGNVYTDILTATRDIGISSVHIASRIKQEISGIDISDPRLGGIFTYNDNSYSGYYNFFNIKVYGTNKILNGMVYAMNNGWNTPYKAIYGGSSFIYNDYVGVNQDTMYYEKFDVSTSNGHYTHQYMQNLAAAIQETNTTFKTYVSSLDGYLDKEITFTIPVYNNMSNYAVTSPRLGNPNNYLKDLTINGKTVNNFSYDTYTYEVNIPYETENIIVGATTINSNASTEGTGTIKNDADNKEIDVVVTSESGRDRTYKINITRLPKSDTGEEVIIDMDTILNSTGVKYNGSYMFGIKDNTSITALIQNVEKTSEYASIIIKDSKGNIKNSGTFKTGDTVTISNSKDSRNFSIVIYGDVNGDGKIDKDDCLAILREINGYTKLENAYKTSADANRDGKIDKDDCLAILRHLNGYTNLNS
ncbi:MAG: SH3 domain-containing protein [Bacilli bacterium]